MSGSEVWTGVTCAQSAGFEPNRRSHLTIEPGLGEGRGEGGSAERRGGWRSTKKKGVVSSLSTRLPGAQLSDCMPIGLVQPSHGVRRRTSYAPRWTSCSSNVEH